MRPNSHIINIDIKGGKHQSFLNKKYSEMAEEQLKTHSDTISILATEDYPLYSGYEYNLADNSGIFCSLTIHKNERSQYLKEFRLTDNLSMTEKNIELRWTKSIETPDNDWERSRYLRLKCKNPLSLKSDSCFIRKGDTIVDLKSPDGAPIYINLVEELPTIKRIF